MENLRKELMTNANDCVGTPYLWGGVTKEGFDCSGLMQYLYKQINVNIPRTSQEQFNIGIEVNKDELKEGDLLFFGQDEPVHVTMYMGNGKMIHAPHSREKVRIVDINRNDFLGTRRVLN